MRYTLFTVIESSEYFTRFHLRFAIANQRFFYFQFKPLLELKFVKSGKHIENYIDLPGIKNKAELYKTFSELRKDMAIFADNCQKVHPNDSVIQKTARDLILFVNYEIKNIQKCAQCYAKAYKYPNSWFTMPCDPPHQIIWAKFANFNYWPAKLMSQNDRKVHCCFFGDHTYGNVNHGSCIPYSEGLPDGYNSHTELFRTAMEVICGISSNFKLIIISNYL